MLELCDFKVEENRIAVVELWVDDGGSIGGVSFEVQNGLDAAEVTSVHEADVQEVGCVVREREMRIKSDAKYA